MSTSDASCTGADDVAPRRLVPHGNGLFHYEYWLVRRGSLYVAGIASTGVGTGLGIIDFGKNTVGPIGPFGGALSGQNAELTGTGDGRLFGFFTTTPIQVAQLDKAKKRRRHVPPIAVEGRDADRLGLLVLGRQILPLHLPHRPESHDRRERVRPDDRRREPDLHEQHRVSHRGSGRLDLCADHGAPMNRP